ncbi:hypothetical protein B0O99DRAFT_20747 [Bisporella sp. PMI_857]|nr:hypothetical protein B0O99DRAFT_20747 [Bisporella sp. PMI_857]
MAGSKQSKYASLEKDDVILDIDLENDSDTTLTSTGFLKSNGDAKRQSRRRRARSEALVWLRWSAIITMQSIIVLQLFRNGAKMARTGWTQGETETGGDVNGLYIPTSHRYTLLTPESDKFVPNMSSDANRMEVRKNWDMLMPLGSGSVAIPEHKNYPLLGHPIEDDPVRGGPIYEAAWTHALHCLYYSVDTYHQLVVSQKFGFDGERNDAHAEHVSCFEYLRLQLLCMADMTLEGQPSELGTTGQGQPHMCRNREEAISWIEERRVDDIQSIVGP